MFRPEMTIVRCPKSSSCKEFAVFLIIVKWHYSVLLRSVLQLIVTVNLVPSPLIVFTLTMEAIRSSETSVLTKTTPRHIPEDCSLHSQRRENFKSYIALTVWAV
jgi:hypothetical protein